MNSYFKRSEFECNCGKCNVDTIDYELVVVLTRLREYFGSPLIISSGNRCESYNKSIGGASGSYHLVSKAVDFIINDVEPRRVQDILETWYPNKYGIGSSKLFTHIDVRPTRARWSY